ncbi:MAG: ABC transporter ATP-binding protein, partial [bacterium]
MKKNRKLTGGSFRNAFREIMWPRRQLISLGLILTLLNRLSGLVLPASSKYLIDQVLGQSDFNLLVKLLILLAISIA